MSGTYSMAVGNKGRIVVPAGVRTRWGWTEGTTLVAVETSKGLLLTGRDEAEHLVRAQLAGRDLVGELLADRRAEVTNDDA